MTKIDRNGNTTEYAYVAGGAAAGALHTITDPVGPDFTSNLSSTWPSRRSSAA